MDSLSRFCEQIPLVSEPKRRGDPLPSVSEEYLFCFLVFFFKLYTPEPMFSLWGKKKLLLFIYFPPKYKTHPALQGGPLQRSLLFIFCLFPLFWCYIMIISMRISTILLIFNIYCQSLEPPQRHILSLCKIWCHPQ